MTTLPGITLPASGQRTPSRSLDYASGCALGALTGVLTALSASPIVATVIVTVLAIATAFVARPKRDSDGSSAEAALAADIAFAARAASFGFTCVAVLLAGVYVRAHNLLGKSFEKLGADYSALVSAHVPPDVAARAVFGGPGEAGKGSGSVASPVSIGALYSVKLGDDENIARLNPAMFATEQDVSSAWRAAGRSWTIAADIAANSRGDGGAAGKPEYQHLYNVLVLMKKLDSKE